MEDLTDDKLKTGEKIRLFRILNGVPQATLAKLSRTKPRMVVAYEQSKTPPSPGFLARCSELFSLKRDWLLNDRPPVFSRLFVLMEFAPKSAYQGAVTRMRNEVEEAFGTTFLRFLKEEGGEKAYITNYHRSRVHTFQVSGSMLFLSVDRDLSQTLKRDLAEGGIAVDEITVDPKYMTDDLAVIKAICEAIGVDISELYRQQEKAIGQYKVAYSKIGKDALLKHLCDQMREYGISIKELADYCEEKTRD